MLFVNSHTGLILTAGLPEAGEVEDLKTLKKSMLLNMGCYPVAMVILHVYKI